MTTFELLIILLAEDRDIGQALVEEFQNDSRDAGEMVRTEFVFKPRFCRTAYQQGRSKVGWIDFGNLRREDKIALRGCECLDITCEGTRIGSEILAGRKLARIDEDREDDTPCLFLRLRDQRQMPCMQRAHGGDERDAFARSAPLPDNAA